MSRLVRDIKFTAFFVGDKQEKFGLSPVRSISTSFSRDEESDRQLHAHEFDPQIHETKRSRLNYI